jgi:hemerythrin-like metal-binding protein
MGITWDDAYRVRIDSLDRQHRKLFELINDLDALDPQHNSAAVCAAKMTLLIRHMREHFRAEEELFARYGYLEGAIHRHHHDSFIRNLTDFAERIDRGSLTLSGEIGQFIGDWLVNHIVKIDMRYSPFLVEALAAERSA